MSHRAAVTPKTDVRQQGFTLVELMIALTVLTTILLLCTVTLIQLGRLFSKGSNQANTQNIARNVINDLAAQTEFGANAPVVQPLNAHQGSICLGAVRYSYLTGVQSSSSAPHILWRDTLKNSGTCQALDITKGSPPQDSLTNTAVAGTEIVSSGMIVNSLTLTAHDGAYTISINLAAGGTDLLSNPGTPNALCKGGGGTEYCSVSSLTQTVVRRLAN